MKRKINMKKAILTCLMVSSSLFYSQKLLTKTGSTNFEATSSSFEEIKASNNATTSILNASNGEFAAVVQMIGFKFKSALMEEHFNENYVESTQYPKATFKGKLTNFESIKTNGGKANIEGILEMHGQKKKINTVAQLSKNGASYILLGNFMVKPEDFAIEIPSLVKNKIAKDIKISFNYLLK